MGFIKSLIKSMMFALIGALACLYWISSGESNYLKNCKELGVTCEDAEESHRVQELVHQVQGLWETLKSMGRALKP